MKLLVAKLLLAERVIYVKCIFGLMKGSAEKLHFLLDFSTKPPL